MLILPRTALFSCASEHFFVFAGEKSQDAGIPRAKLEVCHFEFCLSVEQLLVLFCHYELLF